MPQIERKKFIVKVVMRRKSVKIFINQINMKVIIAFPKKYFTKDELNKLSKYNPEFIEQD